MINLAKGKAYWPTIKEDLRSTYKSCEECLTNAISKPSPHHEVIPSSLELLQPNEVVHIDYMQIGTTNIFILKCKSSGWTWGRIMKDKTSETTCKIFHKYITSYDIPPLFITDEGRHFQLCSSTSWTATTSTTDTPAPIEHNQTHMQREE